jgi:hypothetical protein
MDGVTKGGAGVVRDEGELSAARIRCAKEVSHIVVQRVPMNWRSVEKKGGVNHY